MKIFKSNLFRSTGIYSISSFASSGLNFLLIPWLTFNLSPSSYGIVAMFALTVTFLGPFVGFNLHGAIARKYYKGDIHEFSVYVGNCIYVLIISTMLVLLIVAIFNSYISKVTSIPPIWIYGVIFYSFCQFLILCLLTIWQVKKRAFYFGLIQVSQTFLNVGLTFFFVFSLELDWYGRVSAQIITALIVAVVCCYIMFKKRFMRLVFNITHIQNILRFSLPLLPHSLSAIVIGLTDRFILNNIYGLEETGIYTIAFQIGSLFSIFCSAVNSAFVPWLYEKLNLKDYKQNLLIVRYTYFYYLGLIFLVFIGIIFAPYFIINFIDPSFSTALEPLKWILIGFCFSGFYLMVTNYIFYAEKTFYLGYSTVCLTLINIPLCIFLVKLNGLVGAAQSFLIINIFTFFITWYLSQKAYPMPWLKLLQKKVV